MSGLPDLPKGLPPGLEKYLTKLGQQFEVTQSDRGSPLQSKPTLQDLIDIGVLKADPTQSLKANGKSFTLATTKSWLASAIPTWFTSFLNPPTPAGLVVSMSASNIVLTWTAWVSDYYLQTIVYRATTNNLTAAVAIGSTSGTTYVDNLPPAGGVYFYWIRHQAKSTRESDFNAVGGTTTGNVAGAPAITAVFDATDLVLEWPTPASALTIQFYVVRWGASFQSGIDVGTSNTNTLRITATFGGTRRFWVVAVDVNNQLGTPSFIDITANAPNSPVVLQAVQNGMLVLTYTASTTTLPVASYEVRYGTSWAAGVTVLRGSQTRFETSVNWSGPRTFWIAANDTAGSTGPAASSVFAPTAPSAVTLRITVIDNAVLLSWTASTGSLSVSSYIVDRNGTPVGTINGLFTALYETLAATYTYGVTPIDSAGNTGPRTASSTPVAAPPNYVLYSNANSTFAGTKTQTIVDAGSGALLCNVDTTETWASHFTSRGWNSPQDQINAGYPYYVVGKTSGSYQEVVNYGGQIASSKVTMSETPLFANGAMTISPTLEMGVNGTTFPQSFPGTFSAYATAFNFVRYTLAFSAAHSGTGLATDTTVLLAINPLNYRLDVKTKTVQGTTAANASDVGGTVIDITGLFVSVTAINLTVLSTAPLIAVYDFTSVTNPTQFKVLVFNTSGARASATVSYIIEGV